MSTIAGSPPRPPSLAQRIWHSDNLAGWAFVLPAVFLVALFSIFPIVWGFVLSLQKASLLSPDRPFIGLRQLHEDPAGPARDKAANNTLIYTVLFVPIFDLARAVPGVALNQKIRLIRFYRLAVFIPVAASTIATGIMFLWVFDKRLRARELRAGQDRARAVRVLRLAVTGPALARDHDGVGLAGLRHDHLPGGAAGRAARVGGGRGGRRRRPLVDVPQRDAAAARARHVALVVWSTISALQLFDEVYFVTKGGPLDATSVPVFYVFKLAFT